MTSDIVSLTPSVVWIAGAKEVSFGLPTQEGKPKEQMSVRNVVLTEAVRRGPGRPSAIAGLQVTRTRRHLSADRILAAYPLHLLAVMANGVVTDPYQHRKSDLTRCDQDATPEAFAFRTVSVADILPVITNPQTVQTHRALQHYAEALYWIAFAWNWREAGLKLSLAAREITYVAAARMADDDPRSGLRDGMDAAKAAGQHAEHRRLLGLLEEDVLFSGDPVQIMCLADLRATAVADTESDIAYDVPRVHGPHLIPTLRRILLAQLGVPEASELWDRSLETPLGSGRTRSSRRTRTW